MATASERDRTAREAYEDAALQRDELARENERLRGLLVERDAVLAGEREQVVTAAAERDQLAREVAQLRDGDRAVRRLLIRTELDARTGGVGFVAPDALRRALDEGE
jgi:hypothetical protein